MSILKDIEDRERELEKAARYWKGQAAYWEKRYWDEKFADIREADRRSHEFVMHLIKGDLKVGESK